MANRSPPPRPTEAELVELAGRLSLDGVPLGDEPLWVERMKAVAAWLTDEMATDIAAHMRQGLGSQMVDFGHFADRYGLTPAETELVRTIAGGHAVADHAAAQGISVNTARVHMQRVLEKTGSRRQTDLLRKLWA